MAWLPFSVLGLLVPLSLFATLGSLHAGDGKAVAHRCCDQRFANAWTTGTAPSEGDSELGQQVLLQRREDYDSPFYVYATAGLGRTNNVYLAERHDADSYFWSTLDLTYRPRLTDNLYGDVGFSYETYRHDEHSSVDTDEQDINVGLMWLVPQLGDAGLFAHYSYERVLEGSDFDEIYTSHGARVGIDKLFQLTGASSIYAQAFSRFSIDAPSPGFARRNEYQILTAYQFQPTASLEAQIFYRARLYDFRSGDREDMNHLLGLSVSYWFTNTLGLTTTFAWTDNQSSADEGDYEAFDGGLSLAIQYTF